MGFDGKNAGNLETMPRLELIINHHFAAVWIRARVSFALTLRPRAAQGCLRNTNCCLLRQALCGTANDDHLPRGGCNPSCCVRFGR